MSPVHKKGRSMSRVASRDLLKCLTSHLILLLAVADKSLTYSRRIILRCNMTCVQVRSIILALCLSACIFTSMTRYNLNIAIVDMTNKPHMEEGDNVTVLLNDRVPRRHDSEDGDTVRTTVGQHYDWDQQLQGTIIGSLFWTYMMFQVPSGVFIEWFGSRWLVTLSLIVSGLVNILTPMMTDCTALFLTSRLVLGLFQAGCFPGCFALLVKWMPLYERSFAFSLLRVGAIVGSVFVSLLSGFLCQHIGWPSVFYLPGLMSLAAGLFFGLFMREVPEDHSWVTERELSLIRAHREKEDETMAKKIEIPWLKILTSPPILSYGVLKFAMFWIFFTLSAKLPTYLNDVKGMDIGANGVVNSLFNFWYALSLSATGYLSDRVIEKGLLSRTATRKSFSVVTGFGSASCLFFVPFVSQPILMHFLLYFGAFCLGFSSGGDVPLPSEMSRNYPATIFALVNMISMISGCTSPSFAGLVLTSFSPSVAWTVIFTAASLTMALATVVFLILASAERLPFEVQAEKERLEERHILQVV